MNMLEEGGDQRVVRACSTANGERNGWSLGGGTGGERVPMTFALPFSLFLQFSPIVEEDEEGVEDRGGRMKGGGPDGNSGPTGARQKSTSSPRYVRTCTDTHMHACMGILGRDGLNLESMWG